MRMPSTDSSTSVVRSPTWSCAVREATWYRASKYEQRITSGTTGPSRISPSDHCCTNRMAKPATIVAVLTARKTIGKVRNIRRICRSFVARESSWPEPQRSWKDTGRRCSRWYRSARIVASSPAMGRATSQRRTPKSPASRRPSSSTRPPPSHTPDGSRWATGPSTIHFRTSGISSARQDATTATPAEPNSRWLTGFTYGHRRSSERTADREPAGSGWLVDSGIVSEGTCDRRQRSPGFSAEVAHGGHRQQRHAHQQGHRTPGEQHRARAEEARHAAPPGPGRRAAWRPIRRPRTRGSG